MAVWAFDCESYPIRDGLLAPKPVCFSFASESSGALLHRADRGAAALEYLLTETDCLLVGHNVAFDFAVLIAQFPHLTKAVFEAYRAGRVRCTKIRQQLLDIGAGMRRKHGQLFVKRRGEWVFADYSLAGNADKTGSKGLVGHYLGKDRSAEKGPDAWRMRYMELDGLEAHEYPAAAADYAKLDASDTLEVFWAQGKEAADYNRRLVVSETELADEVRQVRKAFALHLVSCWGLRTDADAVAKLETHIDAEYARLQQQFLEAGLYKWGGTKKAPKLTKNMAAIRAKVEDAYRALDEQAPRTGPTQRAPDGQTKTDSLTLQESGDPLLEELGEAGPISTVKQTFIPVLKRGLEVPINTRFNSLLETGRISSSKPNLNNLPRTLFNPEKTAQLEQAAAAGDGNAAVLLTLGVRESFVPRPGCVFSSVDFDCAELRSLAQVCLWLYGRSAMAEFFQADPNGDPHLALAAETLGITLTEAKALKKSGDQAFKKARQDAKPTNFGLPGGLGVKKFQLMARKNYGVDFDEQEVRAAKRAWFKRWPEMRPYLNDMGEAVKGGEIPIKQMIPGDGPHRIRGQVGYCDGLNTLFQGLTADGAGEALWDVAYECYVDCGTALFGCRVVAFLYDELILEVPADRAHEAALRQTEVMKAAMQRWTPDVPITASPALMSRWWKRAEAVYDKSGRLVPWAPVQFGAVDNSLAA